MEQFEIQLSALNKLGYNCVKIINPINQDIQYFIYDTFIPVDSLGPQVSTHKHVVRGRDITQYLQNQSSALHMRTSQLESNVIASNVNALPLIKREFSEQFLWINYLAG